MKSKTRTIDTLKALKEVLNTTKKLNKLNREVFEDIGYIGAPTESTEHLEELILDSIRLINQELEFQRLGI